MEKIMEIFEIRNYLSELLCSYLLEGDEISGERLFAILSIYRGEKVKVEGNLTELPEEFPLVCDEGGYLKFGKLDEFTRDYLFGKLEKYEKLLREMGKIEIPQSLEDAVVLSRELFRRGLYFEVHEVLERFWMGEYGELREFIQALIQVAVAYYHLENFNRRGYELLMENARELLKSYSGTVCTVDVDRLKERLENPSPNEVVCF